MSHNIIENLRSYVRDFSYTPEDAVARVLGEATTQDLISILRPLLLNEAKNAHRMAVRDLENRAFPNRGDINSFTPGESELDANDLSNDDATDDPGSESQMTRAEARLRLMQETFALPDGTRVRWDEATAEQHLMRAEWLHRKAIGHIQTAERHEEAAERIQTAGVTRLSDLQAVAV